MKKTKLLGLLMALAMLASMLMVPAYAAEVNAEEPADVVVEQTETAAPAEGEDVAAPAEGEEAAPAEGEETGDEEAAAGEETVKKNPIMSIILVVVVIAIVVIAWTYNKRDNKKKITYG